MRIAFIADSVSRRAGGLYDANRRLAQALLAAGDAVSALGVADDQTEADRGGWSPVPLTVVPSKCCRRFGYAPGLEEQLRSIDPACLHAHGLWTYTSVVSSHWHRRTGRPVIIHPHGMLDTWAVRNSAWKKRLAGWLFEYRHLREAGCIRALCQSEADAIRAFGLKNPIAIIPNGMDLPVAGNVEMLKAEVLKSLSQHFSISQLSASGRKVLLYLGRIHPKKGLVNLLKAWAAIVKAESGKRKAEEWILAIAGWEQGGHEAELKRLATELGLRWADVRENPETPKVETLKSEMVSGEADVSMSASQHVSVLFLGPQHNEAKAACYSNCDAFILPSFSEGLPMVILEAWAHGKPVLMTPECNLPEGFAADAAIRIETGVGGIVGGLQELLRAPDGALREIGVNGRKLVAVRFSWPKIATEMKSVYEWILGGGDKPGCVV